jgi:hypothetical protein
MDNINTQTSKKTNRYIVLGVLVVVLLAAAAFVGGSLLRKQQAASEKDGFNIVAAEGLPETPFEMVGAVVSQEGNSLFVQAEQMNEALDLVGEKGGVDKKGGSTGSVPPTEVVITHDTEFFRDATWDPYLSGEADKRNLLGDEIQQEIVPGSADELGSGSTVTIWGERNGDRVVAEVVLYSLPFPGDAGKIFREE